MTRVLITNDDGIDSPGLHELARIARDLGHDVVIAAPATQYSGASASILGAEEGGTVHRERRTVLGLEDLPAFAVAAAPGMIALIAAHGAFGPPPEIVLSGINRGANVGQVVLHSGTVGAALTAAVNGARALAVSLDVGLNPGQCHWDAAVVPVTTLLPRLAAAEPGTVFNVNLPNTEGPHELREGPLASFGIVQTVMATDEADGVRLSVADTPSDQAEGTDADLLRRGFATVTSIASVAQSGTAL